MLKVKTKQYVAKLPAIATKSSIANAYVISNSALVVMENTCEYVGDSLIRYAYYEC